jgi:hypothetical protein
MGHGVRLRQSYCRIARTAAMMAGRYAHTKQFKWYQRQFRLLRSRLGRIIRDIRRRIEGQSALEKAFALGRCYLKDRSGDAANILFSAVGHNFRRILAWLRDFWHLILTALFAVINVQPALRSASSDD